MNRLGMTKVLVASCIVLAATSASADDSPFDGRWRWNSAQSTPALGDPAPNDVTVEISHADGTHLRWSATILSPQGEESVETFDGVPDGELQPVGKDTIAGFRLSGGTLEETFKGPNGETDTVACNVAADRKKMTCKGVLVDGEGQATRYVDVYDGM